MAGVKISQLVSGGAITSQDEFPIARAGVETYKLAASQIVTDGANVGVGSGQLYFGKTTVGSTSLQFRSLSGVDGLSVVNQGNTLVISASGQNPVKTSITGNGSTTTYVVNGASSINANNYRVDIDGVLQEPLNDYYISGSNIVFTSAPPNGSKVTIVNNNLVRAYDIIPSDGSVTPQKLNFITGNVGIGTLTPITKLHITGGNNSWTDGIFLSQTGTSGRNYAIASRENGLFAISDETSPAYRLVINSSGNIGIRTTTPEASLHIGNSDSLNTQLKLQGSRNNTWEASLLTFGDELNSSRYWMNIRGTNETATASWKFYYHHPGTPGPGGVNDLWRTPLAIEPTTLNAATYTLGLKDYAVYIDSSNNVGIGTTNPSQKLVVEKPETSTGHIATFKGTGNVGTNVGIRVQATDANNTNQRRVFYDFTNENTVAVANLITFIESDGSSNLIFGTTPAGDRTQFRLQERVRINSAGNVGIGTTNPQQALHVQGNVRVGDATLTQPSGSAPLFGCRAWVNFDATRNAAGGTDSANTNRFIRASGNVTSVLQIAGGDYRITFTTPMPTTDYCVVSMGSQNGSLGAVGLASNEAPTISTFRVRTGWFTTGGATGFPGAQPYNYLAIFC